MNVMGQEITNSRHLVLDIATDGGTLQYLTSLLVMLYPNLTLQITLTYKKFTSTFLYL